MIWDWQVIIKFILFAMLVVAFTFAIWAYVKTNAIKNSNSPSITNDIYDNNTYVNNIASAPTLIELTSNGIALDPMIYSLTSVDNGTIFVYKTDNVGGIHELDLLGHVINDSKGNIIKGFYVKIKNASTATLTVNGYLTDGNPNTVSLGPGEEVYYGQKVTNVIYGGANNPPLTNTGFW